MNTEKMPNKNSILKIELGAENPILRQKAEIIKKITLKIQKLILDMLKTCEDANGMGLAAPQIGKSLRLFIVRVPVAEKNYFIKEFINPKIAQISEEKIIMEERCLSLPSFSANIERAENLTLEYQDKNGKIQIMEASKLIARVIQHEIDHLDGILICDKLINPKHQILNPK